MKIYIHKLKQTALFLGSAVAIIIFFAINSYAKVEALPYGLKWHDSLSTVETVIKDICNNVKTLKSNSGKFIVRGEGKQIKDFIYMCVVGDFGLSGMVITNIVYNREDNFKFAKDVCKNIAKQLNKIGMRLVAMPKKDDDTLYRFISDNIDITVVADKYGKDVKDDKGNDVWEINCIYTMNKNNE